ncbi:heavy metal-binding domain-containing protein [bacterium]|nr:heavy metal-binding domain-containing protein [bacterium]
MLDLIIIVGSLIICYFVGNHIEKNHYKDIQRREVALFKKRFVSFSKNTVNPAKVESSTLVSAGVVVGCDYFKFFVAGLKNIFGGNVSAYETVLDRGRREALLRMREQALALKADVVLNTKIETVILDPLGTSQNPKVSILAYGTAIKYVK